MLRDAELIDRDLPGLRALPDCVRWLAESHQRRLWRGPDGLPVWSPLLMSTFPAWPSAAGPAA